MALHNTLGDKGESIACDYLQSKSYSILERQWRFRHKEIDIIASKDGEIVFIEVKSRSSDYWGNPEEFVTKQKQKFLIEAAEQYIIEKDFDGESKFDIISIVFDNDNYKIEHIIEAFYP